MKYPALLLAAAGSVAVLATSPALAEHRGISQQEMVQKIVRAFDQMDRDNNRRVSMKDVRRLENRHTRNGGQRARVIFGDDNFRISFASGGGHRRGGSQNIGPINSQTFRFYDLNHDRVIRRKELRRAVKQQFKKADRNGNGHLSQREQNQSRWLKTASSHRRQATTPDYLRGRPATSKRSGKGSRR